MSLERQISQLKKLKTIQPNKEWEKKTKYELLSEISSQNRLMKAHQLTTSEKFDMAFSGFLRKLVPSASKMIAGLLIIMMGSGVSMAAQASVPGQALWPIKRSIEKAELTLTFSAVKETEIHIKHVNKRMDELDKILQDTNNEPEKQETKEKAVKQAVTHLQKDITAADTSLKVVKEEKKKAIEVVELAKKVKDTANEVSNNLKEKQKQVETESGDKEINQALGVAQAVNEEVKDSAVKVALEVHEELIAATISNLDPEASTEEIVDEIVDQVIDTMDDHETSTPETSEGNLETTTKNNIDNEVVAVEELVKEILASEMDDTSVEVENVNKKVGEVAVSDLMAIKSVANQQITEDLEEIDKIEETSDEAVKLLGEAKQLMEDGFLIDAYKKMSEVREDYQKLDGVIDEVIRAVYENKTIDPEVIDQLNQIETEIKEDNTQAEAPEVKEVEASTIEKKKAEDVLADPQQALQ